MQWIGDLISEFYKFLMLSIAKLWLSAARAYIWVVDSFFSFIQWLLEIAKAVCEYLYNLFLGEDGFFWAIVDFVFELWDIVSEVFPQLADTLGEYEQPLTLVMGWMIALNAFFPIRESLFLIGIYVGFVCIVIVVRLIVKAIPGAGG
jgi:hypothetical protein